MDKINPAHYAGVFRFRNVQAIDICRHMSFSAGNAVKYIWRAGSKAGETAEDDLKKAQWYIMDEMKSGRSYGDYFRTASEIFRLISGDDDEIQSVRMAAIFSVINMDWVEAMKRTTVLMDRLGGRSNDKK